MEFETPAALLARLKLSREEFCQRLLTTLILGAPYPRWNTRSRACPEGTAFLRDLHDLSFGSGWPGDNFEFVDEFDLPPRRPEESGGAPDYAVLWGDRVWVIELKTERNSHRPAQIPYYFELARHHHPECAIDLTYLTGPGSKSGQATKEWERFAHVEWADVVELVDRHWPEPVLPGQAEVVTGLGTTIRELDQPAKVWRESHADLYGVVTAPPPDVDVVARSLELADLTAGDGEQRALEHEAGSLEDLQELRVAIRDQLAAAPAGHPRRHVQPWVWNWQSTDGRPITAAGRETGFELRFSRNKKPLYD